MQREPTAHGDDATKALLLTLVTTYGFAPTSTLGLVTPIDALFARPCISP